MKTDAPRLTPPQATRLATPQATPVAGPIAGIPDRKWDCADAVLPTSLRHKQAEP